MRHQRIECGQQPADGDERCTRGGFLQLGITPPAALHRGENLLFNLQRPQNVRGGHMASIRHVLRPAAGFGGGEQRLEQAVAAWGKKNGGGSGPRTMALVLLGPLRHPR